MDEFLSNFDMYFHPLMDLDYKHFQDEKMLPRKVIKLLTYNIFLRPPPVKNNENDWKDERLADFIKLLDCFDILCLQEIFGTFNNRKQELIKYANKSGLFFFCDSPSPSFFSKCLVDGGLLTMSRFPIIESEFRAFNYSVLSDSLANKGILYTKIKIGESYLTLFNTHLQASYFGSGHFHWDISVKTRLDHIQELCDYLRQVIYERGDDNLGRVLLVGDFNVDAHNYEKKKKVYYKNYFKLVKKLNQNFCTILIRNYLLLIIVN
jgi:endonuclease/exonuclease/phosphatase family metal-dependent hydrolase